MDYIQAIVLGIVQGITEFLPISSSAHLVIIPKVFGWDLQSLTFDIFVHSGTLLAIIYYYRDRLIKLTKGLFNKNPESINYLKNVIITTIPTGIIFLFAKDYLDNTFRSISVIVVTMSLGGILLIIADVYSKKLKHSKDITLLNAGFLGVGQGMSLIRGVSRSGMMLTVGLFLGIDRKKLLEYVFIGGIPVILAGLLLEGAIYIGNPSPESIGILFTGFLTAFLMGLLAINILTKFLNHNILIYSGIYRIVLAIVIWIM